MFNFLLNNVSYVTAAIRSFVHHFYPAYKDEFVKYEERCTIKNNDEYTDLKYQAGSELSQLDKEDTNGFL